MDDVSERVREDLDLDVARPGDEAFHEDAVVCEALAGFLSGGRERGSQILAAAHDAHPPAAPSGGGLEEHREAEPLRDREGVVQIGEGLVVAGNDRHLRSDGQLLGGDLVPERGDGRRRRADEDHARIAHHASEVGVLGEKPVARVQGLAALAQRGLEDPALVQVGVLGSRGPEEDGLVGQPHVGGPVVGLRIHGDGADAQPLAGADHPDGDLASIRDQDLGEHRSAIRFTEECFRACAAVSRPACLPGIGGSG